MHEAKRAGRNQVKFFTPSLADETRERLDIEARLHSALGFQSPVDFETNKP